MESRGNFGPPASDSAISLDQPSAVTVTMLLSLRLVLKGMVCARAPEWTSSEFSVFGARSSSSWLQRHGTMMIMIP
jgi:hypothetical protein